MIVECFKGKENPKTSLVSKWGQTIFDLSINIHAFEEQLFMEVNIFARGHLSLRTIIYGGHLSLLPKISLKRLTYAYEPTWLIWMENFEEGYTYDFLPKCKAIGLREISIFHCQLFFSQSKVKWHVLIENLEEHFSQNFLPKCKAISLRKISIFHCQLFFSQSKVKWHVLIENLEEHFSQNFLPKCKAISLRKISIFHG